MNGDPVVVGDHMSLLLVEFALGVLLVLLEEWLEVSVLHRAAENLLMQLLDNFEVAMQNTKK